MKDAVIELVKAGDTEEIKNLDISETAKARIDDMDQAAKEDRYIIKYRTKSKKDLPGLLTKKTSKYSVADSSKLDKVEVLTLNEKVNPKDFAEELKSLGADQYIEYIQPDFRMEYASEEGLTLTVSEDEASDEPVATATDIKPVVPETLSEVIVAIIDTGVDVSHPGLVNYLWSNPNEVPGDGIDNDGNGYVDDVEGWNFYDGSDLLYDSASPLQSAHGTHIAGIIAAANEDYDVKIMPLKVFGENGAYTSDIIEAIEYAEANGAKVVNCSFGSTDNNPALEEAIENSGMLFVCAVGNARSDLETVPIYPACFGLDNIIRVASTNADGGLSYYSNYSQSAVDIAALGRDVTSTLPNGEYGLQSGTSMSAAQVSGAAAAVLSIQNDLSASGLRDRLIETGDMLSNLQDTVKNGRQLNLSNAVSNTAQTQIVQNTPADDFEVNGYNPTQNELYQLYTSSGDVIQVAAGYNYAVVLKEDGTVWTWGGNSPVLTRVIGLSNIIQIASGYYHNLAIKDDGTVWAWGYNYYGQLGNGTTLSASTPVPVSGLTDVMQVSAGYNFSLAVKSDGTAWAWGYNNFGELGNGTLGGVISAPIVVSDLTGVTQVSAGWGHGISVLEDGSVWTWGYNAYGQLGDGTTTTRRSPVQVSGLTGIIQVSAGDYDSLAVKSDGTSWSWGNNWCGQLGDGTMSNKSTPVQVNNLTGVAQMEGSGYSSMALKSDGTVWAWGAFTGTTDPVQVDGISGGEKNIVRRGV